MTTAVTLKDYREFAEARVNLCAAKHKLNLTNRKDVERVAIHFGIDLNNYSAHVISAANLDPAFQLQSMVIGLIGRKWWDRDVTPADLLHSQHLDPVKTSLKELNKLLSRIKHVKDISKSEEPTPFRPSQIYQNVVRSRLNAYVSTHKLDPANKEEDFKLVADHFHISEESLTCSAASAMPSSVPKDECTVEAIVVNAIASSWEEEDSSLKERVQKNPKNIQTCRVDNCGKEAIKRCSRCKKASYCGEEHQRKDWKARHRNQCEPHEPTDAEVEQLAQQIVETLRLGSRKKK